MADTRNPPIEGVRPSAVTVPRGQWSRAFDFMVAQFPNVPINTWRQRFAEGRVLGDDGQPVAPNAPCGEGLRLRYFREVANERITPARWRIVHRDAHLLVVDKPPFLPVAPTGRFVQQSLLVQLQRAFNFDEIAPLHRIDRLTSGLVMFSLTKRGRARYRQLFVDGAIDKAYDAFSATVMAAAAFPRERCSRLERGEPFFRRKEVPGEPNSQTLIDVVERREDGTRFRLRPITGRTHQLRVHMAALGAPLLHDPWYPSLWPERDDNLDRPLQLVARSLSFTDPLTGAAHTFESAYRCGG